MATSSLTCDTTIVIWADLLMPEYILIVDGQPLDLIFKKLSHANAARRHLRSQADYADCTIKVSRVADAGSSTPCLDRGAETLLGGE